MLRAPVSTEHMAELHLLTGKERGWERRASAPRIRPHRPRRGTRRQFFLRGPEPRQLVDFLPELQRPSRCLQPRHNQQLGLPQRKPGE